MSVAIVAKVKSDFPRGYDYFTGATVIDRYGARELIGMIEVLKHQVTQDEARHG